MMRLLALLFLAGSALHFDVSDARGKKASGVTIEVSEPDPDGWYRLEPKSKGSLVLVWPFDGEAHAPEGPGPIPAIVIRQGDEKALSNSRAVAALATPVALRLVMLNDLARRTGFQVTALEKAFAALTSSKDFFERGVGLLYAKQPSAAAEQLALMLKDRQRQLTRIPSEIYAAAMLDGAALLEDNKFDAAAVAFLTALKQRPSDEWAQRARAEALQKQGKGDAPIP
jgi:hypothetical protein